MDLLGDPDFLDWQHFNEQEMFKFVNPNDICPLSDVTNYERQMALPQQPPAKTSVLVAENQYSNTTLVEYIQQPIKKQTQTSETNRSQTSTRHTTRKSSSKIRKLTGREKQMELEKQEQDELDKRKKYVAMIAQLEQKCNHLREILKNIVASSATYDQQMIDYLGISELLGSPNDCDTAG